MKKGINALSYFDGMSCGQIALERTGIKVNKYFASEIDKRAISVTQKNYPDTIQLGDVTKINFDALPKIDLLIGGFPCQSFSFSGKMLNFDDARGQLFFDLVKALKTLKPKYFLFENVKMKKEYVETISSYVGVKPIEINSSLVSAQNRKRLYWTNIPFLNQPEDKKILIKDILLDELEEKYQGSHINHYLKNKGLILKPEYRFLNSSQSEKEIIEQYTNYSNEYSKPQKIGDLAFKGQGNRVHSIYGKNVTISASGGGQGGHTGLILDSNLMVRKTSPVECERLQAVPDDYTKIGVVLNKLGIYEELELPKTVRYKMIGNGFTVDVISHILKNMNL